MPKTIEISTVAVCVLPPAAVRVLTNGIVPLVCGDTNKGGKGGKKVFSPGCDDKFGVSGYAAPTSDRGCNPYPR